MAKVPELLREPNNEDARLSRVVPGSQRSKNWQSPLFGADNRLVMAGALVLMCLGILIGGHLYGRYLGSFVSPGLDNTIAELRAQIQKQQTKNDSQQAQLTVMTAKLHGAQVALDSIMPSDNTYTIYPNLARIVGDGRLMVGMIGTPGNDAIILNVNGKQQSLAAGQTINVTPDPTTQCQLSVQSFDAFKATLVAACSETRTK